MRGKCLRAASWSNDVLSEMDTGYKLRRHAGVLLDNEHYVYGLQANVYELLVGLTTS